MKNLLFPVTVILILMMAYSGFPQKRINLDAEQGSFNMANAGERIAPPEGAEIKQFRRLQLNPLIQSNDNISSGDTIVLDLFDDVSYFSVVEKTGVVPDGTFVVRAKIPSLNFGYCIITTSRGKSLMTLEVPEKNEYYKLIHDPQTNGHILLEIERTKQQILEEGSPLIFPDKKSPGDPQNNNGYQEMEGSPGNPGNPRSRVNDVFSPDVISLMIVYTPAASRWAESNASGIQNTIGMVMEKAGMVLANSNTLLTLNLVHSAEVNYTESDSYTDLDYLVNPEDGIMDQIHELRDTYAADLVVFLTYTQDVGGLSYLLSDPAGSPESGFSLTRVQQAVNSYTVIHEIAHNLSCGHHKQQNNQPGPGPLFSYSAGWRWQGVDGNYCSVMSYESGDYYEDHFTHYRVPYFSNPDIRFQDIQTGDEVEANNALTIRETKSIVASYRDIPSIKSLVSILGNEKVFTGRTTVSNRRAVQVTAGADGMISGVSIYHDAGGSGGLLLGVYADAGGKPGDRLGVTPQSEISSGEQWETLKLVTPVPVTAGQHLWLSWVFENNPGIRFSEASSPRAQSSQTWPGGMPEAFGSSILDYYVYSIYAVFDAAPEPPADLTARLISPLSAELNWTDMSENETGFEVMRSVDSGGENTRIAVLPANSTRYIDDELFPSTTYYYKIRSVKDIAPSDFTEEVPLTTEDLAINPPFIGYDEIFPGKTRIANRRAIQVTAEKDGLIGNISIYHDAGGNGGLLLALYADEGGKPGNRLGVTPLQKISSGEQWETVKLVKSVRVSAGQKLWLAWIFENNPGIRFRQATSPRAQSSQLWTGGLPASFGPASLDNYVYSVYANYDVPPGLPASPADLTATLVQPLSIKLTWTDMADNESGFEIVRSTNTDAASSVTTFLPANSTVFVDDELSPSTTYFYKVRAVNGYGPGAYTTEVSESTGEVSPSVSIVGYDEIFSGKTTLANRRAFNVTVEKDGLIRNISIYHDAGGQGGLLLGIYADNNGRPGNRIGVTTMAAISPREGWESFDLITPVGVTTGQQLWLAWVFEENPGIRFQAGTSSRAHSPQSWPDGMPYDFGPSQLDNYIYSVYATVDESDNPSPELSDQQLNEHGSGEEENPLFAFNVYPNPFEESLNIYLHIRDDDMAVKMDVFDVSGRMIKTLLDTKLSPGIHITSWEGENNQGYKTSTGMYYIRLNMNKDHFVRRVIIR